MRRLWFVPPKILGHGPPMSTLQLQINLQYANYCFLVQTPERSLWSWTAQMHNCGAQYLKASHAPLQKAMVRPRQWYCFAIDQGRSNPALGTQNPSLGLSRLNVKFRPWIGRCTRQSRWAQFGGAQAKPALSIKTEANMTWINLTFCAVNTISINSAKYRNLKTRQK